MDGGAWEVRSTPGGVGARPVDGLRGVSITEDAFSRGFRNILLGRYGRER